MQPASCFHIDSFLHWSRKCLIIEKMTIEADWKKILFFLISAQNSHHASFFYGRNVSLKVKNVGIHLAFSKSAFVLLFLKLKQAN